MFIHEEYLVLEEIQSNHNFHYSKTDIFDSNKTFSFILDSSDYVLDAIEPSNLYPRYKHGLSHLMDDNSIQTCCGTNLP